MRLARRTLLVALLVVLAVSRAPAEEEDERQPLPFFVRDTNAARFSVAEVRRLLAGGREALALRKAQKVLDQMAGDYYRVPGSGGSLLWRLAVEEVRDTLASLPADDRARYDELVGTSARLVLEQAVRHRDTALLRDVVERYGASTVGLAAAHQLIEAYQESGRPREAAYWATQALRFAPRDPVLWLRRLDALAAAGDRDALASTTPPAELAHPRTGESLSAIRARHLAEMPPPVPYTDRSMWGGAPDRARVWASAGPRPESTRWTRNVPLAQGVLDSEPRRNWGEEPDQRFWAAAGAYRPLFPAVVDRTIYLADGRSIAALDLFSGRRAWTFDENRRTPLRLMSPGGLNYGRTSFERAYAPVVWEDLVFATVEVEHSYDRDVLQGVEISTYLPRRRIVAVDRDSGDLRWAMGTHEDDVAALADVSIVAPCVVADGLLLAVGSRYRDNHNVLFLAFDLRTGRLRWMQPLGWGQQELNLFGAPVKELAASAPAVADGTVYASTGLGFVAAVELQTGRPRWLASYEIQEIRPVQYWFAAPLRFARCAPAPVVIAGDRLIVAPTDGTHLHAFDRETGRRIWRVEYPSPARKGVPLQFLGVAHDGRRTVALLAGAELTAYAVEDGSPAWVGHLKDEYEEVNVPLGRGAVAGGQVLIPTNQGLVRFSLEREGSFLGRDPWPSNVRAGNVMPLEQVLLMAGRERLHSFYSWEEIERDMERRRRERPTDATVLLEAAEIYRLGGALDRADKTFREALEIAGDRDPDSTTVRRAERGLHRTSVRRAEAAVKDQRPEAALRALQEALAWARVAVERVDVRVRIDALLAKRLDERAANLERMVEESRGVRARFPGLEGTVPARAMALLRLAAVELERGRPAAAIENLQVVLREEQHAEIDGESARSRARRSIDEITRTYGPEAYREHEEEATRLLRIATQEDDPNLLDRILREYPNASVIPEALLALGKARLAEGRSNRAAAILTRLLGEHPDTTWAATAAALLARAYERAGLEGARDFALAWIEEQHPDTDLEIGATALSSASFLENERERVPTRDAPLPPPRGPTRPLREVHFEPVADEAWGRQVQLGVEPGRPSPLSLLSDSQTIVGFDLPNGRIAFRLPVGSCHRAFYARGVLLLALGRQLRAVDPKNGEMLWERSVEGHIVDLQGQHGQAYALVQDTSGSARRTLRAFDLYRGLEVWNLVLGTPDYRDIRPHGAHVLVRESRYEHAQVWPSMLVIDGLAGRLRHSIQLPGRGRMEREPVLVGAHLVVAGLADGGLHEVTGHRIATGRQDWSLVLPEAGRVCEILADGTHFVTLQAEGSLGTYDGATGETRTETRIFVGDGTQACPYHGTSAGLMGNRLVLAPLARRAPWHVGAWDRRTGKILWDAPWEGEARPNRLLVAPTEGAVLTLASYNQQRSTARVLLHVLDGETGEVRQEIEPLGLQAEHGLLSVHTGWGSVVLFGRAGAALYAAREPEVR